MGAWPWFICLAAISAKSRQCLVAIEKKDLKFIWKGKGTKMDKTILKNKIEMGGIILPNSKTTVIKTVIIVEKLMK